MNELTHKLVISTTLKHHRAALPHSNNHKFDENLKFAYVDFILLEYGVPLKHQAVEIWSWTHPEHLDDEGFIYPAATWQGLDADVALVLVTEAVFERKLNRTPELLLTGYDNLPRQVVDPSPEQVRELFGAEYFWSIQYFAEHPTLDPGKLAAVIRRQFPDHWLPAEHIAVCWSGPSSSSGTQ